MSEYIERDAVTAMLKRECSPRVMAYLVDELCKIHAADVRPVVRAKWEDVHIDRPEIADIEVASMFCPNCNRWYNKVYHYGNPIEFVNFCSFCGADMREVET